MCARPGRGLIAEFRAGAGLLARGPAMEADRTGRYLAAETWSAALRAISYGPSGKDLKLVVPTAPDRDANRARQDDAAVTGGAGMRDVVAMDAEFGSAERVGT